MAATIEVNYFNSFWLKKVVGRVEGEPWGSTPDRHVILMGTETTIGTTTSQDDLFLRFSSQEDFTTWSPTSTNTAGSFRIQDGSKFSLSWYSSKRS